MIQIYEGYSKTLYKTLIEKKDPSEVLTSLVELERYLLRGERCLCLSLVVFLSELDRELFEDI